MVTDVSGNFLVLSTCVLCAEGKYYFQTYKYPNPRRVKTTMNMILVAVTRIFLGFYIYITSYTLRGYDANSYAYWAASYH